LGTRAASRIIPGQQPSGFNRLFRFVFNQDDPTATNVKPYQGSSLDFNFNVNGRSQCPLTTVCKFRLDFGRITTGILSLRWFYHGLSRSSGHHPRAGKWAEGGPSRLVSNPLLPGPLAVMQGRNCLAYDLVCTNISFNFIYERGLFFGTASKTANRKKKERSSGVGGRFSGNRGRLSTGKPLKHKQ